MLTNKKRSHNLIDSEKLAKKLGGHLTAAWKKSKMTKVELAEKANMARMSVTKILQGNQLPQLPALYLLCDILGEDISEILPSLQEIKHQAEVQIILPDAAKSKLPESAVNTIEGRIGK